MCPRKYGGFILVNWYAIILFLFILNCPAVHAEDIPPAMAPAIKAILARDNGTSIVGLTNNEVKVNFSKDVFSCQVKMPVNGQDMTISTNFYRKTPTVDKRLFIDYDKAHYMVSALLKNPKVSYTNVVYAQGNLQWLLYDNGTDVIAYRQHAKDKETIELKEWIYAREPNVLFGSRYEWEYKAMGRNIVLESMKDGSVGMYQEMVINGIDNNDRPKREHIIGTVKKAMPQVKINDKPLTAILEPITYWTRDGIMKKGKFIINDRQNLTVTVDEPATSYPLLIDPTISIDLRYHL